MRISPAGRRANRPTVTTPVLSVSQALTAALAHAGPVERQRAVAKPGDAYILARIKKFEDDWNGRRQNTIYAGFGSPSLHTGQEEWKE